jgi:hypothetical protein
VTSATAALACLPARQSNGPIRRVACGAASRAGSRITVGRMRSTDGRVRPRRLRGFPLPTLGDEREGRRRSIAPMLGELGGELEQPARTATWSCSPMLRKEWSPPPRRAPGGRACSRGRGSALVLPRRTVASRADAPAVAVSLDSTVLCDGGGRHVPGGPSYTRPHFVQESRPTAPAGRRNAPEPPKTRHFGNAQDFVVRGLESAHKGRGSKSLRMTSEPLAGPSSDRTERTASGLRVSGPTSGWRTWPFQPNVQRA